MLRLALTNYGRLLPQRSIRNPNVYKPIISAFGCGSSALAFTLVSPVQKTIKRPHVTVASKQNATENEQNSEPKSEPFTLKDLWDFVKDHKGNLSLSILCALAAAYFNIQIPVRLGKLVNIVAGFMAADQVLNWQDFWKAIETSMKELFMMYTGQALATFGVISTLFNVGEKVACDMKRQIFEQLTGYEMGYFDKAKTHDLCQVLDSDVQEFKHSFKAILSQGIRYGTQCIGCAAALYTTSPELTTSLGVGLPLMIAMGRGISMGLRKLSRQSRDEQAKASSLSGEALEQIKTVKVFNGEQYECAKFSDQLGKVQDTNFRLGMGIAGFQALSNVALNAIVGVTVAFGGWLVNENKLSGGDLMTFLTASQIIQKSLMSLSQLAAQYVKLTGAGQRIKDVLVYEPDQRSLVGSDQTPFYSLLGNVEFRDVSFSYPSREDAQVLNNVSFSMLGNQTIAIVGQTGSGKSTIGSLLTRLYEPSGGQILLDEKPLCDYDPKWIRGKAIAVVSQEPTLFDMSILENIRYGRPDASDQEVREAAVKANCSEFISQLPKGFQTNVGERGSQLSGGQKQRVAIARALIKNPTLLILDEATSALDAHSEKLVQSALNDATCGRSTLVIAHRLSTIKNADKIVVLHHGNVVEVGKHDELVKQGGRYANLVKNQQFS